MVTVDIGWIAFAWSLVVVLAVYWYRLAKAAEELAKDRLEDYTRVHGYWVGLRGELGDLREEFNSLTERSNSGLDVEQVRQQAIAGHDVILYGNVYTRAVPLRERDGIVEQHGAMSGRIRARTDKRETRASEVAVKAPRPTKRQVEM